MNKVNGGLIVVVAIVGIWFGSVFGSIPGKIANAAANSPAQSAVASAPATSAPSEIPVATQVVHVPDVVVTIPVPDITVAVLGPATVKAPVAPKVTPGVARVPAASAPVAPAPVAPAPVAPVSGNTCADAVEALLTGTPADIDASMKALIADRKANTQAREYAQYYTVRDRANKGLQETDAMVIQVSCD